MLSINSIQQSIFMLILAGILSSVLTNCAGPSVEDGSSEENIAIMVEDTSDRFPDELISTGPLSSQYSGQRIVSSGMIEIPPSDLLTVHSRIAGQIKQIKFLPGDYVRRGAMIASLYQAQLIEKQRQLLETAARLSGVQKELVRQQTLAEGQATARAELDRAISEERLLRATLAGLKAELQHIGIDLIALEEKGDFQTEIGIYAEVGGYVQAVHVNRGSSVTPEDKIMDIANRDHLHLELSVPGHAQSMIAIGQSVEFTLTSGSGGGTAEITKINPMVDPELGTLGVHCHLEEGNRKILKPGLFVEASIQVEGLMEKGLPRSAVLRESDQYFGFIVEGEKYRKVELVNARVGEDYVFFDGPQSPEWVLDGAYYLNAGE